MITRDLITVTEEESAKDRKVGTLFKSPSPRLCLVPHGKDRTYQTGIPTSPLTDPINLLTSALALSLILSANG